MSTSLTSRENQVLQWLAEGKRDRKIGVILNVSSRTVQKHVANILEKLHVETRGAAAAWWYEHQR
jgi:DNA-binding CsgD family transcriptional regulator